MEEGSPQRQPLWDKDDGGAGTTWWQKGLQKEQKKMTKSSTSTILKTFRLRKPPMTHQKGCLLLPNLPLQSSSSAETKETLILPSSSSAPPFNSWCLFTALLPSLPHFYSSPLPATLPPKQPALGGARNTTMELGWWRGSKKSWKLSCNFSQMFLTDLMWFTWYWYILPGHLLHIGAHGWIFNQPSKSPSLCPCKHFQGPGLPELPMANSFIIRYCKSETIFIKFVLAALWNVFSYSYKSISGQTNGTGEQRDEGPNPGRCWNTENTQPCLRFNLMFSWLSQESRISHKANSSHKINEPQHSETGTLVSKKKIETLVSWQVKVLEMFKL